MDEKHRVARHNDAGGTEHCNNIMHHGKAAAMNHVRNMKKRIALLLGPGLIAASMLNPGCSSHHQTQGGSDATIQDGAESDANIDATAPLDGATDLDAGNHDGGAADACTSHWTDAGTCDCTPGPCSSCQGHKNQTDGCGHQRSVTCSLPAAGCPAGQVCNAESACVIQATNPVIAADTPDPSVLREVDPNGQVTYYLTHTIHNRGDLPVYQSSDLIHWVLLPQGLFGRTRQDGNSLQVNSGHFCSVWAPHVDKVSSGVYLLGFSAQRYASAQSPCPAYDDDGGVYLASSSSPTGPFATSAHRWEPFPAGANEATCPADTTNQVPHSVDDASTNCQGTYCHRIIRLDSDVFHDEVTDRWWMAYSWYTNEPPLVSWEQTNYGEHLEITELDAADPFAVRCDTNVPQIFAANPHDPNIISELASGCTRCGEMLSFTRGRYGEEVFRDGFSWGVTEGGAFFRRGNEIYLLISGSMWDSPYYHVYWVAAPTMDELAYTNPNRIQGRYLIPSQNQAFGHGSPVLGPDGQHWYFVHHHLDSNGCANNGDCTRDLWVSPIQFEDHGDGRGDVYIVPRFPAEDPTVEVYP